MSPPRLRMRSITVGSDLIRITVDSPTRGVAILDATIARGPSPAPLHWRAGDWTKPPLDISLGLDGRLESVQVVFQDEEVPPAGALPTIEVAPGVPVFDVDDWPADRYVDARTVVRAKRLGSGELLVSIGDDAPTRQIWLGEGLQFGLDVTGEVVEIVIGPLDDEQWRLIGAAAP